MGTSLVVDQVTIIVDRCPHVTLASAAEHGHGGVVAADAGHATAAAGARAAEQDPLPPGGDAPAVGAVLLPRPVQVTVEDVAAGHPELALDVERRLRLDAGPALGVRRDAVPDRLGQHG